MKHLFIFALLFCAACQQDETLSAYTGDFKTFQLRTLNGENFAATTTMTLAADGQVSGRGPCNTYSTTINVPYPWFEIGPIAATRRACPELDQEQTYFNALSSMTFAEVSGPTLVLSNDAGEELVFYAAP